MYYDIDGQPISLGEWVRLFENMEYRRVAEDIRDDIRVSTVWLGLDHRFMPDDGPPIIFETMVFGGPLDQWQTRYATYEEAEVGHQSMVEDAFKRPRPATWWQRLFAR